MIAFELQRLRRLLVASLTSMLVLSCVRPARASETDAEHQAMVLFDQGRKLAREGRCADAVPVLLESIRHAEGVGALLNLGSCYETMGRMTSAHGAFVRAEEVATARDDPGRRKEAARRAASTAKEVSVLVVHVPAEARSAGLEIRLDGEVLPRARWEEPTPLDAGSHELEVLAPPAPTQKSSVQIPRGGARIEWTVPPPRALEARPTPVVDSARRPSHFERRPEVPAASGPPGLMQRRFGILTGAVGTGGILTGAIFGLMSMSAHASVLERCATYPVCASSDRGAIDATNDRASTTGTLSTISFVAGAALLVGGALLFIAAPSR